MSFPDFTPVFFSLLSDERMSPFQPLRYQAADPPLQHRQIPFGKTHAYPHHSLETPINVPFCPGNLLQESVFYFNARHRKEGII